MKEELLLEMKDAMKSKDEIRKNTIMMLRAAILQIEKDELKTLTQEEMFGIVAKEVKKRKDSISDYIKGGRKDIANQIEKEIEILSKYLPKQLSNEEVEKLIDETIKEENANSPKDMGKVMQSLKTKTFGKADGKIVSELVKSKLNNI